MHRCYSPAWSRGGNDIAVHANDPYGIWTYHLSSGAWTEIVTYSDTEAQYATWLPADSGILFEEKKAELWIAYAVAGATPEPFLKKDGRRSPAYGHPQWRRF